MAVDAIFCNIEFATFEPFYIRLFKIPFQNPLPFFSPMEIFGNIRPKDFGIYKAFLIRDFIIAVVSDTHLS
jgi:hypothetical protein